MSATHAPPDVRRVAGPLALAAGPLMLVAEVAMWPFDPGDHLATTRNVVFQVAGAVYFAAFCLLVLAAFTAYLWQASDAGRLGAAGTAAAVVGTMALGGDLWFESFAVPWLADRVRRPSTPSPPWSWASAPSRATCRSQPGGRCSVWPACGPGCSRAPSASR